MSVADIQGRIAAIQSQFGMATAAPVASAAAQQAPQPAQTQAPEASFAAVLEKIGSADIGGLKTGTPKGDWVAKLPPEARRFAGLIERAAKEAGIDPRVVAAVAWTESGFRPDAVSGAGARGLMQLMPATARGLGVNPDDPGQSLTGGARYLAEQIQRFGQIDLALAAYNAGPGTVARHGGIPPYPETRAYVGRVLDRLRSL
jgi:soluble lytic murein transglycosylase-like protein